MDSNQIEQVLVVVQESYICRGARIPYYGCKCCTIDKGKCQ